ncbi:hypothetical protein E2542_SST19314 [Spatholobus suberectus]|nr:hypothetical protein E2542_SST19314 [Spatholobus suberectus]
MHRSSSISRASGEFLVDISATALAFPSFNMADSHGLPIHHSVSDVTKKEMTLHVTSTERGKRGNYEPFNSSSYFLILMFSIDKSAVYG